jgi:hypothetical protein
MSSHPYFCIKWQLRGNIAVSVEQRFANDPHHHRPALRPVEREWRRPRQLRHLHDCREGFRDPLLFRVWVAFSCCNQVPQAAVNVRVPGVRANVKALKLRDKSLMGEFNDGFGAVA